MFTKDQQKRIKLSQVATHPWVLNRNVRYNSTVRIISCVVVDNENVDSPKLDNMRNNDSTSNAGMENSSLSSSSFIPFEVLSDEDDDDDEEEQTGAKLQPPDKKIKL
jgi:hypothetical protein